MTKYIVEAPTFRPSQTGLVLDPQRPILVNSSPLSAGQIVQPHQHPRGQLLWAMRGVLRVEAEGSVWIVPPSHTVWIPGGTLHNVTTETDVLIRNLYIDPSHPVRTATDKAGCRVLLLTPLLREMILRLCDCDLTLPFSPQLMRLSNVIMDEIEILTGAALSLPSGIDPRLLRVTAQLIKRPHDTRTLPEFATFAGASSRTLERLFREETGQTFRQWRSRLRLLSAIERLSLGQSSSEIAFSLGYRSTSAFVASFREQFGLPPQSYLHSTS